MYFSDSELRGIPVIPPGKESSHSEEALRRDRVCFGEQRHSLHGEYVEEHAVLAGLHPRELKVLD